MAEKLETILWYTEASTKWPTFCRRYFRMHFFSNENCFNALEISLKLVSGGLTEQSHKSHNAPVSYPTMQHSGQKCAHFCSEYCTVGYGTGALRDLWIRSIDDVSHLCHVMVWATSHYLNQADQVPWCYNTCIWPHQGQWVFAAFFQYHSQCACS